MMCWSPRCYTPSVVKIGPPVLEKIFEVFFSIYGHDGHLGNVTSIMLTNFHFLVPESFHTKFGSEWPVVSEKIRFEFCMYTTLGQGQEMTLTFNTHKPS